MDVFYYWKNYEIDVRNGRIGYLKSDRNKLGDMRDRHPDQIWAFKTPPGRKGELQLVATLAWSDTPKVKVPPVEAKSVIYYDPHSANTLFYGLAETETTIGEVSGMLRRAFPVAFRSNFQGDNGLQVIDGDLRIQIRNLAQRLSGPKLVVQCA